MSKLWGMRRYLGVKVGYLFGIGIMGACFQALHAAPGQRPMEIHYVH